MFLLNASQPQGVALCMPFYDNIVHADEPIAEHPKYENDGKSFEEMPGTK